MIKMEHRVQSGDPYATEMIGGSDGIKAKDKAALARRIRHERNHLNFLQGGAVILDVAGYKAVHIKLGRPPAVCVPVVIQPNGRFWCDAKVRLP